MNKLDTSNLEYYDEEVIKMICEKYNIKKWNALRDFIDSKTHELLEDAENGLTIYGAGAIFDMWECEKLTGDPRNSTYIRWD